MFRDYDELFRWIMEPCLLGEIRAIKGLSIKEKNSIARLHSL